jgi:hypothetical protein
MEPNYLSVPVAEVGVLPRSRSFLIEVHSLYRKQFARWFSITVPTSVLAAAVLLLADRRIKEIFRNIPRGETQYHLKEVAATWVLRFGSFFVSWLLGCFALAAIATVVGRLDDAGDDGDVVWRHDSHQRAREHLGALVVVALVTFCSFLAGMAAAEFVELAAARLVGWAHISRFFYVAAVIGYVLVASIVSWLGMAIPLVLKGTTTVWSALGKSVELSSGYEGALFLLVVESMLGSYLAWYATYHGWRLLFPVHLRHTLWYGWGVYVVAVLATAAVEPPIFIGFSLLADPELLNAPSLPSSEQTPHI